MGDSKNMNWSHNAEASMSSKWYLKQPRVVTLCLNSSRIINLEKLKEHLQVISQHAATCQACADNALSGNENALSLILSGAKKNNGLCSVLTSRCAGCLTKFNIQKKGYQWWSILGV